MWYKKITSVLKKKSCMFRKPSYLLYFLGDLLNVFLFLGLFVKKQFPKGEGEGGRYVSDLKWKISLKFMDFRGDKGCTK